MQYMGMGMGTYPGHYSINIMYACYDGWDAYIVIVTLYRLLDHLLTPSTSSLEIMLLLSW